MADSENTYVLVSSKTTELDFQAEGTQASINLKGILNIIFDIQFLPLFPAICGIPSI